MKMKNKCGKKPIETMFQVVPIKAKVMIEPKLSKKARGGMK